MEVFVILKCSWKTYSMVVIRFYQHSLLSKESFENKSAFIFPIRATLSFTSLSEQPKTIEKGWRSIRNGFVEEKRCLRHTGPRGWVECSHQSNCCYHKFLHQFLSKFSIKISTKLQLQFIDERSASKSRSNFNLKIESNWASINFQRLKTLHLTQKYRK